MEVPAATIMRIKAVSGQLVAFTVADDLYYLKEDGAYSVIYNRSFRKLSIPNLDSWFQVTTGQRHSFQGILDMVSAFRDGLTVAAPLEVSQPITARAVIEALLYRGLFDKFKQVCWFELIQFEEPRRGIAKCFASNLSEHITKHGVQAAVTAIARFVAYLDVVDKNTSDIIQRAVANLPPPLVQGLDAIPYMPDFLMELQAMLDRPMYSKQPLDSEIRQGLVRLTPQPLPSSIL